MPRRCTWPREEVCVRPRLSQVFIAWFPEAAARPGVAFSRGGTYTNRGRRPTLGDLRNAFWIVNSDCYTRAGIPQDIGTIVKSSYELPAAVIAGLFIGAAGNSVIHGAQVKT